jgi:hypothetical protein
MNSKPNILILTLLFALFAGTQRMNGQMLSDSSSVKKIIRGIDFVYNLEFKEAEDIFNNLKNTYPGHPINYLLDGMLTYWQNYPLLPDSPARSLFENDLRTCIELCKSRTGSGLKDETLLTNLCARGFLLLFYTDNELNIEVFPLATSSYSFIRQAFDYTSSFPDFYFFTGVYDYYTEVYPEEYPIYKPLMLLFKRGDKIRGLQELNNAAANSIFLKAESLAFLSDIYLTYEKDLNKALSYSLILNDRYPANMEYRSTHIKYLLLEKRYDEAESILKKYEKKDSNPFYRAQSLVLNGIISEKKYHNLSDARKFYINGIRELSSFGYFGNEYTSYAYFGLSRISSKESDQHYRKVYRKMALKLSDFKEINFDE